MKTVTDYEEGKGLILKLCASGRKRDGGRGSTGNEISWQLTPRPHTTNRVR